MERKLYIEYRLYFDPEINQEFLKEAAAEFQEHIHDEWNTECPFVGMHAEDVTYEIVMEISHEKEP